MIPSDSEWSYAGPRAHHVIAASAACVLSVVVHIALLIGVLKMDIRLPGMLSQVQVPERLRPMHLRGVARAPASPVKPAADEEASMPEDIVETAEKLGIPVPASLLSPPSVSVGDAGGETPNLAAPEIPDEPPAWHPRQEIVAIEQTVAKTDVAPLDRVTIPVLERVIMAPDLALPVERSLAAPPPLQSAGPGRQALSRRPLP